MKIKMRKYFYYLSADQRGLNQGYCTFNNWKLLPVDKYIIQLDGKREGGRRVFYQVEPNWPLAYSTMPVLGLRDARPAGCSICESTMPRAQNRAAKGSTLMEDETRCPSGYIIYLWWYSTYDEEYVEGGDEEGEDPSQPNHNHGPTTSHPDTAGKYSRIGGHLWIFRRQHFLRDWILSGLMLDIVYITTFSKTKSESSGRSDFVQSMIMMQSILAKLALGTRTFCSF